MEAPTGVLLLTCTNDIGAGCMPYQDNALASDLIRQIGPFSPYRKTGRGELTSPALPLQAVRDPADPSRDATFKCRILCPITRYGLPPLVELRLLAYWLWLVLRRPGSRGFPRAIVGGLTTKESPRQRRHLVRTARDGQRLSWGFLHDLDATPPVRPVYLTTGQLHHMGSLARFPDFDSHLYALSAVG